MKKTLSIFLFLATAFFTRAQIKELEVNNEWQLLGEVKYVGAAKASLKYLPGKADTTYLLLMRDMRYELKKYFSVQFEGQGGTVEELYKILLSFFEKENRKNKNYERLFNLGDTRVHVQHYKQLTGNQVMLSTKEGNILLGEGEIKRLFGKK